jgi:heparin binding hemagglutinin HbhA
MAKLPTTSDTSNERRPATAALEQARTPLYAVLGAGELASEAVREYVAKARAEAGGQTRDVQTMVGDLPARLAELQTRLGEVRNQVRTRVGARVGELPEEVAGLRGRLESGELRHALESYAQSLHELYERLAVRGEAAVARLREQPRVRDAIGRIEEAADTTEERVGKFVEDARVLVADVLGLAGRRAPSDLPAGEVRDEGDNGSGARRDGEAPAGGATAPTASHHNGASSRVAPAKAGRVQPSRGTASRKPSSPRKTGSPGSSSSPGSSG